VAYKLRFKMGMNYKFQIKAFEITIPQTIMKFKIANYLIKLPRSIKRLISLCFDLIISIICSFGFLYIDSRDHELLVSSLVLSIVALLAILQIGTLWASGTYQTVARFLGLRSLAQSSFYLLSVNALIFAVFSIFGVIGIPNSFGVAQPALFFSFFLGSRFLVAVLLSKSINDATLGNTKTKKALIYGAGDAGRQLAMALHHSIETQDVGFLEDDASLQGAIIQSVHVYPTGKIEDLIKNQEVTHVLLALPSVSRSQKSKIIHNMSVFGVKVLTLPTLSELAEGNLTINNLKEVQIEDLLAREITRPNELLLNKNTRNQVVLVTGAGGSIGSELCRQILKRSPKKLVLVEMSEVALYQIEIELTEYLARINSSAIIVSRLCNVRDAYSIDTIISQEKPNTLYHAAAYKHVPIVENNICEGILNNVQGTLNCINSAVAHKVNQFILISTDKAVRPSNVMGASKRVAEMILQAHAQSQKSTKISMVRFGNVLGSSGSVVPRFRQQIASGGPITLTHAEITRYFMTISEASQLVMQAGAMGGNGEVFLLDMGEPIKIIELATRMIELSGLKVKDAKNYGDIEIKITGLRPGEKLYEELLIGEQPIATDHPEIFMGMEDFLPEQVLKELIEELISACKVGNSDQAFKLINSLIRVTHTEEILDQFDTASGD
jgi:FlaA1/EpsC-like NDP-sugar epimerase